MYFVEMVSQRILVKDKKRNLKIFLKVSIVLLVFVFLGLMIYYSYLGIFSSDSENTIVLENPLNKIVLRYASYDGGVIPITPEQQEEIILDGILEFNEDYINYILLALGVDKLHKSLSFENPRIKLDIGETWSSEIIRGVPNTYKRNIEEEDIKFIMTKEEGVRALLSNNLVDYMKESVITGRTQIEMVASKGELFSKGYLGLYEDLTGEEADI